MGFRIAVSGTGRISWLLENDPKRYKPCTHLGGLVHVIKKKAAGYEILLRDKNTENLQGAQDFIRKSIQPSGISSFQNIRDIPLPDLHIISTPSEEHIAMLMESMELGIPRIVVEKPLGVNPKEMRELSKKLKKYSGKIWIHYERRYHPKYIQIKNEIASRKWGALTGYYGVLLSMHSNLYPETPGNEKPQKEKRRRTFSEGILLRDTTHLLDLAQFFAGEITDYHVRRLRNSHTVELTHQSEPSVQGSILTQADSKIFHFEINLYFEKAVITAGNGFIIRRILNKKSFLNFQEPEYKTDLNLKAQENPFIAFYKDVLFEGGNSTSIQDAIKNVHILTHPS